MINSWVANSLKVSFELNALSQWANYADFSLAEIVDGFHWRSAGIVRVRLETSRALS